MKWSFDKDRMCHVAHPRGFRVRVGRFHDTTPGKNSWWNVETSNRWGHLKFVAQGWCKTVKSAKRISLAVARAIGGVNGKR